ncbi:MAG: SDR family oxidoreductase [Acidobacteria bacterium]|nr:MAG: SDR family oxidoreductase [Acidobacteriota bacterium]
MINFAGLKIMNLLITGAASGLGRTLALDLAREGHDLALFDLNFERLGETARECHELGSDALPIAGDVTKPADCKRFVDAAVGRFGRIDALIANAGISMWAKFEDIQDLAVFPKLMEVNYLGVVYCTYHSLPHLKQSRGVIVAISSIQGKIGVPYHTGYVASKHAVQGFFNALRTELRGTGVDILLVLPHWLTGTRLRQHAYGKDGAPLGNARSRHSRESVTVEACSKAIIAAMGKRQRELVIPPKLKALPWLSLISPRLVEYLVTRKVDEQR